MAENILNLKCPEGVTGVDSEGCLIIGCDHFFEITDHPDKDKYDYCGYFDIDGRFIHIGKPDGGHRVG